MATANSPFPRWKGLIATAIQDAMANKEKGILYYNIATCEPGDSPIPHVRTVVHRGFVNEQRDGESKTGVKPFDASFGSNSCLMTTTDVRAPKAQQIIRCFEEAKSSRGEISWWMESKNLQIRIAGTLHLLPRPDHEAQRFFNGASLAPPPSAPSQVSGPTFDWSKERKRIFEKLSPALLASFARPTPGSAHPNEAMLFERGGPGSFDSRQKDDLESPWPLELPAPGKETNEEQRKLLMEAERNFALIVLSPEHVDVLDLESDKRSLFTRVSGSPNSDWNEKRLVP